MLGRQELSKRTAESIRAAKAHFERAIALDPNYALAYVGLADSHATLPEYAGTDYQESFAPRQAAIDKAIELDPGSGEAYASFGNLRLNENRTEEAEEYFLKAIDLRPNYATAHHWYALLLRDSGRMEEAILQIREALELDPAAPILSQVLAGLLNRQGRLEEAQAAALDGVRRNPEFPGLYDQMADIRYQQGRIADALRWTLGARKVAPMNPGPRRLECRIYIDLGDDKSAENCLSELRRDFPQYSESDLANLIVDLWVFRSQRQEAIEFLEHRVDQDAQNIGLQFLLAFHYHMVGRSSEAKSILEKLAPAYFTDDDVAVNQRNLFLTIVIGIILYGDGMIDRANNLFEDALTTMQAMHRTRGVAYAALDTAIYATRGDLRRAISALREAIDDGWRKGWWQLRYPVYESMRTDDEWNALVHEIEADIIRQREWFEIHKNDPLF